VTATDYELRHGYTLADLNHVARAAVAADRLMAMSATERYDLAWSAIAEHLYSAETPPHRSALIATGWQAIARHVRDGLRQRGYTDSRPRDWSSDQPTMPRYVQFWHGQVTPSHEDKVVEKLAATQVFAVLRGPYRDAVLALAVHDDYRKAAEALGISDKALRFRLGRARRRFLIEWHEGETPRRSRRTDRRVEAHGKALATACGNGHPWTPENTRTEDRMVRGKPQHRRVCRACERDRAARRGAV
jgi:hypothetical protein